MDREFRILLVYPNLSMMLVPSTAVALFTGILRGAGFTVDLFDTTHYVNEYTSSPQRRVKYLQARAFDEERDLRVTRKTEMFADFAARVDAFRPDLMVVSTVEDTFLQAVALLDAVKDRNVPSVVGGVFVTAAPELAISYPEVRAIGVGEGENTVLEVARRLRDGRPIEGIPNLWLRRDDGSIERNPLGPLIDVDRPVPDYSLFDPARFNRPMGGRIFRTIPLETYRGCPYECTFCNSPMQVNFARDNGQGNFLRRKRIINVERDILKLIDRYDPEYFYIIDDSFLARPQAEIEAFCAMYSEFRIPFWFNTRPENCTLERLIMLREVGADRISVGLEHGNQEFRRKVLRRAPSDETLLRHMGYLADSGIAFSLNNIIGFPGETREMIFETIEFNRRLRGYDTLTVSIFTPYHGTVLRQMAIEMGYLQPDVMTTHTTSSSLLRMPHLSADEIDGIMRTFVLYVRLPKSLWPEIALAEALTDEGDKILEQLKETYKPVLISKDQTQRLPDWEEVFGPMSKTQMR